MNNLEMKEEFLLLYDKVTNFAAPGYEDIEISRLLSGGQEVVYLHRINVLGNKYGQGFEGTERRRKEFAELVSNVTLTSANISPDQTGVKPNGTFFNLPTDFGLTINEEVTISSDDKCLDGQRIEVKPITHDEYNKSLKNPFKRPDGTLTWRMDFGSNLPANAPERHEIITDGTYTVDEYHIRYMRRLKPIIIGTNTIEGFTGPLDSELNDMIHRAIIEEAVKMASGVTDPQFYQIRTVESQNSE